MKSASSLAIWIGQAEVAPLPGNTMFSGPAIGGFIAAVAYVENALEFSEKVRKALEQYGVFVAGFSGVRLLSDVLREKTIEEPLMRALPALAVDGVALGTLFTYASKNGS